MAEPEYLIAFKYLFPAEILAVMNTYGIKVKQLPDNWYDFFKKLNLQQGQKMHIFVVDALIAYSIRGGNSDPPRFDMRDDGRALVAYYSFIHSRIYLPPLHPSNVAYNTFLVSRMLRIFRIRAGLRSHVALIPIQFNRNNPDTDFSRMAADPRFRDSLFVFNDNEEQFLDFQENGPGGDTSCLSGEGNGAIRPYQCKNPPRATGIPTGYLDPYGGYSSLDDDENGEGSAKDQIDRALDYFEKLVFESGFGYRRVFYSVGSDGRIGSGKFAASMGQDVKMYIPQRLQEIIDQQYPSSITE